MNKRFVLEICVDSVESAISAIKGGAHRLEICSSLKDDGLTPTLGLIQSIDEYLMHHSLTGKVDLYAMIRPRPGDFVYFEGDLNQMLVDMYHIKKLNMVKGFVFGALKTDGSLDEQACKMLLSDHEDLENTFHRAIDMSKDPCQLLEQIIGLGFKRVLTSGHAEKAIDGVEVIKKLIDINQDRIKLCVGAGITDENLEQLIEKLNKGTNEYHGSAKILQKSRMETDTKGIFDYYVASEKIVSNMISIGEKQFNMN